jgi:lipoyl(octanoyl) transferase
MRKGIQVKWLGCISYTEALNIQRRLVRERRAGLVQDTLLLLEHPHVITAGKNARVSDLLVDKERLDELGVGFFFTDRGGNLTYHGPGQLIGYPIIDLGKYRRSIKWYISMLEEVMIKLAEEFGIKASREPGQAGVWVEGKSLGTIGIKVSGKITSHGFAFNLNTELAFFKLIVPCGLPERGVTSVAELLGRRVNLEDGVQLAASIFEGLFYKSSPI